MKQNKHIQNTLKLAMALFISAPVVAQEAQTGVRMLGSGKRARTINAIGDAGDPRIGGGDPRSKKSRRISPSGGIKRRVDKEKSLNDRESGLLIK